MKTLLLCSLVLTLLAPHRAVAQAKTPPPFPGWANKGATPAAGGAADNKDILGEWVGHLMDGDGSNPGQRRGNMTLTITPEKITQGGGGGTNGEGTYKISGTGKLRRIDAKGTAGQYAGKEYEGIFTIEGDTLKWCSGNPGKGRPTALRTNTGAGHFLMVLTRKP
jgi:uncharacterized protein (TIGR03067 family)